MRKKNICQLFYPLLLLVVMLPLRAGSMDSVPAAATVSPASITFSCDKSMQTFRIDNKGTGWKWKVKVASNGILWLDISESTKRFSRFQNEGTESQTLYLHISENPNDTIRTTHVTLFREGMKDIIIPVTQMAYRPYVPSPHKGWAGCNVYWDPTFLNRDGSKGRLTFDDVGVTTHEDYQGAYFYWGSLVALSSELSPDCKRWHEECEGCWNVLFSPNPPPGEPESEYENNFIFRSYTRECPEAHYLLQKHNPKKNLGDICKYMTDRGWAPGVDKGKKWRIPTMKEFGTAEAYTVLPAQLDGGDGEPNGRYRLPKGLFTLRQSRVSFPRSGFPGGQPGDTGIYITASPSDGRQQVEFGTYFGASWEGVKRLDGVSEIGVVRCVLE